MLWRETVRNAANLAFEGYYVYTGAQAVIEFTVIDIIKIKKRINLLKSCVSTDASRATDLC